MSSIYNGLMEGTMSGNNLRCRKCGYMYMNLKKPPIDVFLFLILLDISGVAASYLKI